MSFYLTVSSDASKDTFPNNHGGDFKVQLDHGLDMRSQPWEVALVEMAHVGQAFPNLSTQNSVVNIRASGTPPFENDYIITWDQALELSVEVKRGPVQYLMGVPKSQYVWFSFPRQHYSWASFKETFEKMYNEK